MRDGEGWVEGCFGKHLIETDMRMKGERRRGEEKRVLSDSGGARGMRREEKKRTMVKIRVR